MTEGTKESAGAHGLRIASGAGLAGLMERAAVLLAVGVDRAPPAPLQRLLDGLAAGRPLHLYLPP
jgi:hypothetical protein